MTEDELVESLRSLSSSLSSIPSDFEAIHADEMEAKARLSRYKPTSRFDDTNTVLNSFIDNLPPHGQRVITRYIATCEEEETLRDLSIHLYTAILAPIRANGGQTPSVSVTPSPFPQAEAIMDEVAASMLESGSRSDQKWLKKICLERDNYRCVLTGFWDPFALGRAAGEIQDDRIMDTQLAHIIPYAMGKYENRAEEVGVARIWATLHLLFPQISTVANFNPDQINQPMNALTMVSALHTQFGRLCLALESTAEENTYAIRTYPPFQKVHLRDLPPPNEQNERLVRFEKHGYYDLPSRVLLETHAAVAKILHASGKAEEIEKIMRDREEIGCLASDGSTDLQNFFRVALHI